MFRPKLSVFSVSISSSSFTRKICALVLVVSFALLQVAPTLARPFDLDLSFGFDGNVIDVNRTWGPTFGATMQNDGKLLVAGSNRVGINADQINGCVTRYDVNGIAEKSYYQNMGGDDYLKFIIAQNDGKIVAVGAHDGLSVSTILVKRFLPDLTVDTTFGNNGLVTTVRGQFGMSPVAAAVQSDGKIVVGAQPGTLMRYNIDGTLDTTFNGDGFIDDSFRIAVMIIQNDHKILVAGSDSSNTFSLKRYTAAGELDHTFNRNGTVVTSIGNSSGARALAIQSDGKIVAAGSSLDGSLQSAVIVRYNFNGSLDTTFDNDGIVTARIADADSFAGAIAIQSDGKIIINGGSEYEEGRYKLAVARFNPNGSPDTTFGSNGSVTLLSGGTSNSSAHVFVRGNGKIVAVNTLEAGRTYITQFNSDGSLDLPFGPDGQVVDSNGIGRAMAILNDDKIVMAGLISNGTDNDFVVAKYDKEGLPDTTFGTNGRVITNISNSDDNVYSVAAQTDGKIVVTGTSNVGGGYKFALARYNQNGTLDTTFNEDGVVTTPVGSGDSVASSVAIQSDGKIVVAGYGANGSNVNFALARYNTDGSLDTTFDGDGIVITDIDNSSDSAAAVALQSDGKIVAAGSSFNGSNNDFALARYNTDGSLDSTFDSDGKVLVDIFNNDRAYAVAIQSDGKVIAAGSAYDYSTFGVIRLNSNGSLDNTFGSGGKVSTSFISNDSARAIAIQRNGKIVVAGYTNNLDQKLFAVVRYRTDGSIDDTFGKIKTTFPEQNWYGLNNQAYAAGIQRDGKIIVAGNVSSTFAMARYEGDLLTTERKVADFDGDGRTDISVFRPADGTWYLLQSGQGFAATQFGLSDDVITPGDFDGDRKTDIAVWRPSDGTWYLLRSQLGLAVTQFGANGDVPVPADYDGDGKTDVAVWRPSTGVWYLQNSSEGFKTFQFGLNGDKPVVGDYDGDGKFDVAVYRPGNGTWYVQQSSNGFAAVTLGSATDIPAQGDFDGDGKYDLTIYRPSNGTWYSLQSQRGFVTTQFGLTGDIPATGDYDGDGKFDISVYRPSSGTWYIQRSQLGTITVQFGLSGDKPVPSAYVGLF